MTESTEERVDPTCREEIHEFYTPSESKNEPVLIFANLNGKKRKLKLVIDSPQVPPQPKKSRNLQKFDFTSPTSGKKRTQTPDEFTTPKPKQKRSRTAKKKKKLDCNEIQSCNQNHFLDYMDEISSKWKKNKSPPRSAIKTNKTKQRMSYPFSKKVQFKDVKIRKYPQSGGIYSSGVTDKAPSLHLGIQLIEEIQSSIDSYETKKQKKKKEFKALTARQRLLRLRKIKPMDTKSLKQENKELKIFNDANYLGCNCKSIFKQNVLELVSNIRFELNKKYYNDKEFVKNELKSVNKMKKKELIEYLKTIQLKVYKRYDVCCMDERCDCFSHDIPCHIEENNPLYCSCGGNYLYLNKPNQQTDTIKKDIESEKENQECNEISAKKSLNRLKKSFACGNPNSNNFKTNVLKVKDETMSDDPSVDEIGKKFWNVGFKVDSFQSPLVKQKIEEWAEFYKAE